MILDAALEFLWSNPFREMTVRSVMESTNLSRSAFYRHFHDLHLVMESLLLDLEQEILEVAAPWLARTGPPLDLLQESLSGLFVCAISAARSSARSWTRLPLTNGSAESGTSFSADSMGPLQAASRKTSGRA